MAATATPSFSRSRSTGKGHTVWKTPLAPFRGPSYDPGGTADPTPTPDRSDRGTQFWSALAMASQAYLAGDDKHGHDVVAKGACELLAGAAAIVVRTGANGRFRIEGSYGELRGPTDWTRWVDVLDPLPTRRSRRTAVAPLETSSGRMAIMVVRDDGGSLFDTEALQELARFSAQVEAVIDVASARRRNDIQLIADERDRIARDIHDHTMGRLFGVGMSLQSLIPLLHDQCTQQRIHDAVDQIDRSIAELRMTALGPISGGPRRVGIDDIRNEARSIVTDRTRVTNIAPSVVATGPTIAVDPRIGENILAALGEALMNVVKHANATAVDVLIANTRDELRFTVTDNGIGIHPTAASGNGLRNISHRASALGGSASFASGPLHGTIVHWRAPLDGAMRSA